MLYHAVTLSFIIFKLQKNISTPRDIFDVDVNDRQFSDGPSFLSVGRSQPLLPLVPLVPKGHPTVMAIY